MAEKTFFSTIYDSFWRRITDDMYMEWTQEDTEKDLQGILLSTLYIYEFPRFNIYDYVEGKYVEDEESETSTWVGGYFNSKLTQEEINIISLNMVIGWFERQLASTRNTKMQYSGSDFKFTSQANHMAKLKVMIDAYKQQSFHLQRLYKRRKINEKGKVVSTLHQIMEVRNDD